MSLVQQYLAISHRFFFDKADQQKVLQEIELVLDENEMKGHWIYLCHSDPLKFALSFLSILDRGGAPIALANSKGVNFDSMAFLEGTWFNPGMSRKSDPLKKTYAVPTSGTTGQPKLCEFSWETATQNAMAHAAGFGMQGQHEILQTLPVHHSYGIIAYILTPLVTGCSVNFCPGMVGLRTLRKKGESVNPDSVLHISPSQARFILKDGVSVENLRKVTIGGGSVTIHELEDLSRLLPNTEVYVSYGLTEAGPRVTAGLFSLTMKSDLALTGAENWIGKPIQGVQAEIIKTDDNLEGRLCIHSPYLKQNSFQGELQSDRLVTRDRVRILGEDIFFISREDDIFKYGGVTIYPQDIETLVRKWSGVTDVILFKEQHPVYGDVPLLVIEGSLSRSEAQTLSDNEIPFSAAIKEIHVQEKFPRQSLEKIDRQKLLALIRSQTS